MNRDKGHEPKVKYWMDMEIGPRHKYKGNHIKCEWCIGWETLFAGLELHG